MNIRLLSQPADMRRYGQWIAAHPQGTLWQSLERRAYLEALGKEVRIYAAEEAGNIIASALIAIDRTAFGLRTWEIPRGPVFGSKTHPETKNQKILEALLECIVTDAKRDRCLTLSLSPVAEMTSGIWPLRPSRRCVHCEATRILDLAQPEEAILAQMKPKGRYNIRIAEKHGVTVRQSDDIDAFYTLVQETAHRDGFTPLPKEKYHAFLHQLPGSFLLTASLPNPTPHSPFPTPTTIASLLGVQWNGTGIYYYGASAYAHRAAMAPYALQWAAIRHCRDSRCTQYDLLGVAPPDAPRNHPWQGITRFKEHFGGQLVTYPPEQQLVLRPVTAYALDLKRKILRFMHI